jgi:hypothetical protein
MTKKDLKPIERNTPRANKMKEMMKLAKTSPKVKKKYLETAFPDGIETQTGSPIPVNASLGSYDEQILHRKVTEYFINKAGTIVLVDCPCRTTAKCEKHDIS